MTFRVRIKRSRIVQLQVWRRVPAFLTRRKDSRIHVAMAAWLQKETEVWLLCLALVAIKAVGATSSVCHVGLS